MRFRRRAFGRRLGKRTVAWIPGYGIMDDAAGTDYAVVTLANLAGAPRIWGAAVGLTTDTDLTLHGGEDAVLTRIRGRLMFTEGRKNEGGGNVASGFAVRVLVVQTDTLPGGSITPFNFCTSAGLGNDDILWSSEAIVSSLSDGATGSGLDAVGPAAGRWLEVDVKAKRRIQSDRHIYLWFQTAAAAGTTNVDFRVRGGLRMLLKRPR